MLFFVRFFKVLRGFPWLSLLSRCCTTMTLDSLINGVEVRLASSLTGSEKINQQTSGGRGFFSLSGTAWFHPNMILAAVVYKPN